jgi:hypothetical protein
MAFRPERITLLYQTEDGWSPEEILSPKGKKEWRTRAGRRMERRRRRRIKAAQAFWDEMERRHEAANQKDAWGSVRRRRRNRVSAVRKAVRAYFR